MEETLRFRPAGDLDLIRPPWLPSFSATHSFGGYSFGKILLPILGCRLNKDVFLILVILNLPIG
jgi:hypothetical protein